MKQLALSLICIACVCHKVHATGGIASTYAVIVGVSQYNDRSINPLKFADKDAEMYKSFLQTPKGGNVPEQNIALLTNDKATRVGILQATHDLFTRATEDDVIIFYYSGHGVPDVETNNDLYFATYDTKETYYPGSALNINDVVTIISRSHAKLKLFLADACHTGGSGIRLNIRDDGAGLVNKLIATQSSLKQPGWAAITAARSAEFSFEEQRWGGGHGVFTYELIIGLQGDADKTSRQNKKSNGNNDGIVTARELFDYLNNVIPVETDQKQHPDIQGHNEDDFPVSAVSSDKFSNAVKKYTLPATTGSSTSGNNGLRGKDEKIKFDVTTQPMTVGACSDGGSGHSYGEYEFFNDYGEDILYTSAYGRGISSSQLNLLMAPGDSVKSTRLYVGTFENMMLKGETSVDCKFYFRTVDENKPIKYGTLTLVVEACKTKKIVLSRKNLYLSTSGEKY